MTSRLRPRVNHATIVAYLALFVVVTGSALAAGHYLITSSKQISPDVRKALRATAYQASTNVVADPLVLTLHVPAGSYTVVAKAVGSSDEGWSASPGTGGSCVLSAASSAADYSVNTVGSNQLAAYSNTLAHKFAHAGTLTYRCAGSGGTPPTRGFYAARIVATAVGKIR